MFIAQNLSKNELAKQFQLRQTAIIVTVAVNNKSRSLSGSLAVLAPREAVTELTVGKLMQTSRCCHAEVAPHVLAATKVQLLHCARAWLETLKKNHSHYLRSSLKTIVTM